jgi:hypothetical protein
VRRGIILLALGAELLAWRLARRFYDTLAADAHAGTQGEPARPAEGWLSPTACRAICSSGASTASTG